MCQLIDGPLFELETFVVFSFYNSPHCSPFILMLSLCNWKGPPLVSKFVLIEARYSDMMWPLPEIAVAFRFVVSQTVCLAHVSACVELEVDFRQSTWK